MARSDDHAAAGASLEGPAALLFDLGGVLVQLEHEAFRAAWVRLGVPRERLERFLAGPLNRDWNLGRIPAEDFPRLLRRGLELPGWPAERLRAAWISLIGAPLQGPVELAERAARAGMRVGLLSNTDPWHWEAALGGLPRVDFDPLGLSFDLAALKPDEAAFRNCLAAGDPALPRLEPARTLFIDDNAENLAAAARLGFRTWLHSGEAAPALPLAELGLAGEKGVVLELDA
jgi:FMN phosphatase YigB (HAD superfamily)